jgi:hypothetical protein
MLPQNVGTSQNSSRGVSQVDQACHFICLIQYFFNTRGINCDASVPIGLACVVSSEQGSRSGMHGGSSTVQGGGSCQDVE